MEYISKLKSKQEVSKGTMEFVFERPNGFFYEAGQYVNIGLLNPKYEDERGGRRAMSLASYPSEDELTIVMRMSDSGFKKSIAELEPGEEASIRGPFGHLVLPKSHKGPVVFIAGGIGITPFWSMLKDEKREGFKRPVTLLYSNRNIEDITYHKELSEIKDDQFTYIPTLTADLPNDWEGESGRVDSEMLKRHVADFKSPLFLVVGLNDMVKSVVEQLVDLGVPQDKIKIELYGNY